MVLIAVKKISPKSQIFIFSKVANVDGSSELLEKGVPQGTRVTPGSQLIPIHIKENSRLINTHYWKKLDLEQLQIYLCSLHSCPVAPRKKFNC